jgi:cysteine desulfurase family protein
LRKVYLDNSATTFPKPDSVIDAVADFMRYVGASPGRGGYSNSLEAGRIVFQTRKLINGFFNGPGIENVIFTQNITESLNMAINGIFKDGWHIITTSMEHNSVMRPLRTLQEEGKIELTIIKCDKNGFLNVGDIEKSIKDNTKAIVMTHASNLVGTIMPAKEVGRICRKHGLLFILDTAQSAGVVNIDFQKFNLDILAFTGHKALLGPQGTGGFLISPRADAVMLPIIQGGTGSKSDEDIQPDMLPDKYESGTLNAAGIAGLKAGIEFIEATGIEKIREHESKLLKMLIEGLHGIENIIIYGPMDVSKMTAVVSINLKSMDASEFAYMLDRKYGIMARSGLHCAPYAHRTVGSYPIGSVRLSIGYFNTEDDIRYTLGAIREIAKL